MKWNKNLSASQCQKICFHVFFMIKTLQVSVVPGRILHKKINQLLIRLNVLVSLGNEIQKEFFLSNCAKKEEICLLFSLETLNFKSDWIRTRDLARVAVGHITHYTKFPYEFFLKKRYILSLQYFCSRVASQIEQQSAMSFEKS